MKLKVLFSTITFSTLICVSANAACEAPKTNVKVQVDTVIYTDYGPDFCYVTDLENKEHYDVHDCGFNIISPGDILTGTVYTAWTHKDPAGNPVCDYKSFVIKF